MKLRWSVRALNDMVKLRDYIAADSVVYAQQFLRRFKARIEVLTEFPHSGRYVPEAERDDIREIIYQGYRAIYHIRPAQQEIVMITIVHGSRDLTNPDNQPWGEDN